MKSVKSRLDRLQHGADRPVLLCSYADGLYTVGREQLTPAQVRERFDLDASTLVVWTYEDSHPLQTPDEEVRRMTWGDD